MDSRCPDRLGGPIRVLVADDHAIVRAAVARVLQHHESLEVVAEVGDGIQVLEALTEQPVDVVLMDLRMPRLDGIQATRAIRCLWPGVAVVGFSAYGREDLRSRVIETEAGADGVVSKSDGTDRIVASILRSVGATPQRAK